MILNNRKLWIIFISTLSTSIHAGEWKVVTSKKTEYKEQKHIQRISKQTARAYKKSKLYASINNFLGSGKSPNACNKDKQTLMHVAAKRNHPQAIALLHANGGEINIADAFGSTPLHWAAGKGAKKAVKKLLALGAGICIPLQDKKGRTPLHRGAGVSTDVVYQLTHDANMQPQVVNYPDACGMTALHWAASGGKIGALKILLVNQANVNAQDYIKGRTALHWVLRMRVGAPQKGGRQMSEHLAYDMLEWLLDYGADPLIPDARGMTPIDWAQAMNWHAEAQLLASYLPENMH